MIHIILFGDYLLQSKYDVLCYAVDSRLSTVEQLEHRFCSRFVVSFKSSKQMSLVRLISLRGSITHLTSRRRFSRLMTALGQLFISLSHLKFETVTPKIALSTSTFRPRQSDINK